MPTVCRNNPSGLWPTLCREGPRRGVAVVTSSQDIVVCLLCEGKVPAFFCPEPGIPSPYSTPSAPVCLVSQLLGPGGCTGDRTS